MRNLVNNSNWRVDAFDTPAYIQERALIEVTTHSAIADDTLYLTCGTITATYYVAYENKLVIDVSELVRMNASGTLTLSCGNATDLSVSWTRGGLINPANMIVPNTPQNAEIVKELNEKAIVPPTQLIEDMPFAFSRLEFYKTSDQMTNDHKFLIGGSNCNLYQFHNSGGVIGGATFDDFGRSYLTQLKGGATVDTFLYGIYKNYWAKLFNSSAITPWSSFVVLSETPSFVLSGAYSSGVTVMGIRKVGDTSLYDTSATVTTTKKTAYMQFPRNNSTWRFGTWNTDLDVFMGWIDFSNLANLLPQNDGQGTDRVHLKFDYYADTIGIVHIENILISTFAFFILSNGIVKPQLPCRKYACVQWVSRSGVTKRATWEVRKIADTTSESTELERIDNAYDVRKGQEQTMQLVMENLAAYDFWYYSDIVTSSDVRVAFDASGYDATNDTLTEACKVEVTDKKVQQLDGNGGGFSTLAVNINFKRYDTV